MATVATRNKFEHDGRTIYEWEQSMEEGECAVACGSCHVWQDAAEGIVSLLCGVFS